MLLRKSMKSIQLALNEYLPEIHKVVVSAAAFTQARRKLKHTAFIELNTKAIVNAMYADTYKKSHGLRILAIDGSKIILPQTKETENIFGTTAIRNKQMEGHYVSGLASVLYDVLNNVALDARLVPGRSSEIAEAIHHLSYVQKGDLVIFDRGYSSYQMMSSVLKTKADFLIRCRQNSFNIVNTMLRGEGEDDIITTLKPSASCRQKYGDTVPAILWVRFVRVTLNTGEIEVLATSLTDTKKYPLTFFKELYWKRWSIETFYGTLKNRLCLENFSGISSEAIKQDFYATVFLAGLESILTEDVDESLAQKDVVHNQQVNKAVSFNALKNRAFDLFLSDLPIEEVITELTELFMKTPTLYRENKKSPRGSANATKGLNFWRRVRKHVF